METLLNVVSVGSYIAAMIACIYLFTEIIKGKVNYKSTEWGDKIILLLLWGNVFRNLYEDLLRYLS